MAGDAAEAPLSVAEAVGHIDRATSFVEPLRRRTEGVTIALWGFISACVVLSNGLIDDSYGFYDAGGWKRVVSSFLWLPWTAIGVMGTLAVWRIAEVSVREPMPGRRRSPVTILAWLGVFLVALAIITFALPVGAAGIGIAVVGLMWLAAGALDVYKATPAGRRTLIATGIVIVLVGSAYGWATAGSVRDGWMHFELAAVPALGLVPILAGLVQALRG